MREEIVSEGTYSEGETKLIIEEDVEYRFIRMKKMPYKEALRKYNVRQEKYFQGRGE